jgi:hypothetical protein
MRLDKLLTALIQVHAQVPDVWVAIAGKGLLRNDLERQVQQHCPEGATDFDAENRVIICGMPRFTTEIFL